MKRAIKNEKNFNKLRKKIGFKQRHYAKEKTDEHRGRDERGVHGTPQGEGLIAAEVPFGST